MARWAQAAGSAAVVATGDNFYEFGVEHAADEHWRGDVPIRRQPA